MNISLFILGWRRRSLLILDAAGCPARLARWRCPTLRNWGKVLHELTGGDE